MIYIFFETLQELDKIELHLVAENCYSLQKFCVMC